MRRREKEHRHVAPGFKTYAARLIEGEGKMPGKDTLYSHWGMLFAQGQRSRWEGKHAEAISIQAESDSVKDLIEKQHGFDPEVADVFLQVAHEVLDEREKRERGKSD